MNYQNINRVNFCRNCGGRLTDDSRFCGQCGTEVIVQTASYESWGDPSLFSDGMTDGRAVQKPRREWPTAVLVLLGIILLSAAVIAAVRFWPTSAGKEDINALRGCPEFYNLEWGMTVDQAGEKVELKHKIYKDIDWGSLNTDNVLQDSALIIDDGQEFYLYGSKTKDVLVAFDGEYLKGVYFILDEENASLEAFIKLYTERFGPATTEKEEGASWEGAKTTIFIYDRGVATDGAEKALVVCYFVTENSQFTNLSFDGPDTDPCGFLGKEDIFNKKPNYYTKGLKRNKDYEYEKLYAGVRPGFERYTLYPQFAYMGIEKGSTAIEFTVGEGEETINSVSYLFLLDETNAVNRVTYIKKRMDSLYGGPKACDYTSLERSEAGILGLSFDEAITRIEKGTQGIYHFQWKRLSGNVTLQLTINPGETYYDGAVTYGK